MDFTSEITGAAIGAAATKLQGKSKEEKTSFGAKVLRFFVSLIWVLLAVTISLVGAAAMVGGALANIFNIEGSKEFYTFGIGISIIFALITFLIPYLRKKGSTTRWCGILAICDALWWAYLMITM